jgi:hypothetical protein
MFHLSPLVISETLAARGGTIYISLYFIPTFTTSRLLEILVARGGITSRLLEILVARGGITSRLLEILAAKGGTNVGDKWLMNFA